MGIYSTTKPKITWGTSFSNTLTFEYQMDNVVSYAASDENSQFALLQNGSEYSWIPSTMYILEGDVRWIRDTDFSFVNGWRTTAGWLEFLEYSRAKNAFRFYPDRDGATYITSYLVEPINATHGLEIDGTRRIRLVIRNGNTPYEGY